jgi:pilus assembly protein CpaF
MSNPVSLRERLENADIRGSGQRVQGGIDNRAYQKLKQRLHAALLDRVDLESLQRLTPEQIRVELRNLVEKLLEEDAVVINDAERKNLTRDIQNEMLGFGPLEPLLEDPTVSDILVNTYRQIYVERRGKLELTDVTFSDDAHLMKIIDKIVSRVGRRIDESSPMVDARLPDGSRVNAIIPPLAIDGPIMSIRRFSADPLRLADLVAYGSMTADMAEVLQGLGKAKVNIVISGGTGSGKTTMLNVISGFISPPSASSPSRMRPSCSCSSRTWCGWKRARPTSKARAKSRSARWCAMRCACGPTASSSARCAAPKRSTCWAP